MGGEEGGSTARALLCVVAGPLLWCCRVDNKCVGIAVRNAVRNAVRKVGIRLLGSGVLVVMLLLRIVGM